MNLKEVNSKQIQPTFAKIVVTANKYRTTGNIIISAADDKMIDDIQTIVAVGPLVEKSIKVGDVVKLNFRPYEKVMNGTMASKVNTIKEQVFLMIPKMELKDKEVLLMDDRDIEYIINL